MALLMLLWRVMPEICRNDFSAAADCDLGAYKIDGRDE